jgi:glycosyltransferase involved in cell wall biosynthesis
MAEISVIIPAFNSERFLAAAIQSVQAQTLRPLEILVIDDGSTDGTAAVARGSAGPVPVFYYHQENRGAGLARNLGVSRAQGEWIAFLDADDVWYPHKLSVQHEQIQTYPDSMFFFSDFDILQPDGTVVQRPAVKHFAYAAKRLDSMIFRGHPFPLPSTVLLRKSVFVQMGGFNQDMRGKYYEDYELFARIVETFPFYFNAQNLIRYRFSPISRRLFHCTPNVLIFFASLWQLWRDQPEKQAMLVKEYAYHYSRLGKYALQDGDYLKAREYYRSSFNYYAGIYFPWHWKNFRRWSLCYLPGLRQLYRRDKAKQIDRGR